MFTHNKTDKSRTALDISARAALGMAFPVHCTIVLALLFPFQHHVCSSGSASPLLLGSAFENRCMLGLKKYIYIQASYHFSLFQEALDLGCSFVMANTKEQVNSQK